MQFLIGQSVSKPNFIFVFVDDLNDYAGYLNGHPQAITPNIDALAASGTAFTNAYCSAPGCAPSRLSMLSGKDLNYTQVYNNEGYAGSFRTNFTAAKNNTTVYSFPEVMKDDGGYFTFGINKIFHNEDENDMDKSNTLACDKGQSWNRQSYFELGYPETETLLSYSGFNKFGWGIIPDSLEKTLVDFRATDTAIQFIADFASGAAETCNKPFFWQLVITIHIRPETCHKNIFQIIIYLIGAKIHLRCPIILPILINRLMVL